DASPSPQPSGGRRCRQCAAATRSLRAAVPEQQPRRTSAPRRSSRAPRTWATRRAPVHRRFPPAVPAAMRSTPPLPNRRTPAGEPRPRPRHALASVALGCVEDNAERSDPFVGARLGRRLAADAASELLELVDERVDLLEIGGLAADGEP